MSGNKYLPGLPSSSYRPNEVQARIRDTDLASPLYLNESGQIAIRKPNAVAKLDPSATLADVIAAFNRMVVSDADGELRES